MSRRVSKRPSISDDEVNFNDTPIKKDKKEISDIKILADNMKSLYSSKTHQKFNQSDKLNGPPVIPTLPILSANFEKEDSYNKIMNALADLYLNVKIKKEESIHMNEEKMTKEKVKLFGQKITALTLIEYIKTSFEIIIDI